MNIKKLMESFSLEGKITQAHGEQIEEILTEALKERDELLEQVQKAIFIIHDNNGHILAKEEFLIWAEVWLDEYELLDKDKE